MRVERERHSAEEQETRAGIDVPEYYSEAQFAELHTIVVRDSLRVERTF